MTLLHLPIGVPHNYGPWYTQNACWADKTPPNFVLPPGSIPTVAECREPATTSVGLCRKCYLLIVGRDPDERSC